MRSHLNHTDGQWMPASDGTTAPDVDSANTEEAVNGRGSQAGQELVETPLVRGISFTGSNEVSSRIVAL